jgi:Sodium/hydrogen exchanger family
VTYEFLGKTAEAAVYSYVGISLYTSIPGFWSFSIIIWQLIIIIVGRVIAVIGTFYLFRLCFKKKTINFKELMFITYGGMIRGAIAFALVLKIPYVCPIGQVECFPQDMYEVARSTTLVIVMVTTLLFGTFMKQTQTWLLGASPSEEHHADPDVSMYEEIVHPNADKSTIVNENLFNASYDMRPRLTYLLGRGEEKGGFPNSRFAKWFANFDENSIRPFLIRNYTLEAVETMDQLNKIMTKNFDDQEPDSVQN